MATTKSKKTASFRPTVKRLRDGFWAKVTLAPGLVVTLKGNVKGRSSAALIAESWDFVKDVSG